MKIESAISRFSPSEMSTRGRKHVYSSQVKFFDLRQTSSQRKPFHMQIPVAAPAVFVLSLNDAEHCIRAVNSATALHAAKYCDERVCVCLSASTHPRIVVALSSSGGVAIRYALPVLVMTSYLHFCS